MFEASFVSTCAQEPQMDWHATEPNGQRCIWLCCIEQQGIFTPVHSSMNDIAWILFIFAEYIIAISIYKLLVLQKIDSNCCKLTLHYNFDLKMSAGPNI